MESNKMKTVADLLKLLEYISTKDLDTYGGNYPIYGTDIEVMHRKHASIFRLAAICNHHRIPVMAMEPAPGKIIIDGNGQWRSHEFCASDKLDYVYDVLQDAVKAESWGAFKRLWDYGGYIATNPMDLSRQRKAQKIFMCIKIHHPMYDEYDLSGELVGKPLIITHPEKSRCVIMRDAITGKILYKTEKGFEIDQYNYGGNTAIIARRKYNGCFIFIEIKNSIIDSLYYKLHQEKNGGIKNNVQI